MALAQHKYASNVVEACFKYGSATQRELLLRWVLRCAVLHAPAGQPAWHAAARGCSPPLSCDDCY